MFLETSMAPCAAYGFKGGPVFSTTIVILASGREQRNINWSLPKHQYSCPFQNIDKDAFLELKRLFMACRGQANGFRFKDAGDFEATDEAFATGDGATSIFQLYKTSTEGATTLFRKIVKPNSAGFIANVNGAPVACTVSTVTGLATFAAPPAGASALTWSGTFDVPVRFAMDFLPFSIDNLNAMNGSVDLVEDPEA